MAKNKTKIKKKVNKGRPPRIFTVKEKEQMEQMAFDQCQNGTIAKVLSCSVHTLEKAFCSVLGKKRAEGKAALRRSQMKQAGDCAQMAIFLGKQYLNQSDKQEVEHSGNITIKPVNYGNANGNNPTL